MPSTLHITVGDRESAREDALEVARAIDSADSPDDIGESMPDHLDGRSVLQFGSYDDLHEHLSPLRLELIQAIVETEPSSIREAARLVDRDVSDVHADLQRLEMLEVVAFEDGGRGGATIPIVPYERIEMHIEYPLVDDDVDTDAAASAD
ncbi:transcriptional regulator [Salinadaptatus halalkaliphilus]|uniref:Transcriptional regulator n=1 Tax=Salinadaptatus halalkaliphilus TaxID=2419781 RepID=A0A4S3TPH4_9EURY|nr:transcriptional regulator [Salinadaptatus halalkaliphilus]